MKKLLFQVAFLMIFSEAMCHAYQSISESIYTSSYTVTNDTLKRIPGTVPGTELFAIAVASPSTGGFLTIYDSSASATSKIADISMTTVQNPQFFVRVSSGITYSTVGNVGGVSIMYRNPNVP